MPIDPAPQNARILEQFGLGPAHLLGTGGESRVYALGADKILRLPRGRPFDAGSRMRLAAFLKRIDGHLPFATPEIIDVGPREAYTIERRLPGRAMSDILKTASDDSRDKALRNYAAAVEDIRSVEMPDLPYGHVVAHQPIRESDWRTFVRENLARFRARNRITIAKEAGDPYGLFDKAADMIGELPERPLKGLVHGDYFPGNVLLNQGLNVSAVIDFGTYTVVGDPLLDLAVSYLTLELMAETSADDARFVRELIMERHGEEIAPAFRFYRAYLAFSMADPANAAEPYPKLYGWSIAMLKLLAADRLPV
jgi:aminoglycoside phosphotransferase (APT) family kinase protein